MSTQEISDEQKEQLTKLTVENFWQIAKQIQDDVKALHKQLDDEEAPPKDTSKLSDN